VAERQRWFQFIGDELDAREMARTQAIVRLL